MVNRHKVCVYLHLECLILLRWIWFEWLYNVGRLVLRWMRLNWRRLFLKLKIFFIFHLLVGLGISCFLFSLDFFYRFHFCWFFFCWFFLGHKLIWSRSVLRLIDGNEPFRNFAVFLLILINCIVQISFRLILWRL